MGARGKRGEVGRKLETKRELDAGKRSTRRQKKRETMKIRASLSPSPSRDQASDFCVPCENCGS